jgi:hypothetical protein
MGRWCNVVILSNKPQPPIHGGFAYAEKLRNLSIRPSPLSIRFNHSLAEIV